MDIPEPPIPAVEEWPPFDKLAREKDIVGVYISGHPLDEFKVQLDQLCTPGGIRNLDDLAAARGRTISFGGMVTEADHKMTRNGKPFGAMTMEDYFSSFNMTFWNDDYLKFREFLVKGWFLYVKGKVQMRPFRGSDQLEFKVMRIELLSDVLDKMAKRLRVQVAVNRLDEAKATTLCDLLEAHAGGVGVTLEFHHDETVLDMISRTRRVELSQELIDGLEALDGVAYKVVGG